MDKKLPARPHLDHLRRQAKALLADLAAGKSGAVAILREHLPEAKNLTAEQIRAASFRLDDAQAALARQSGFAGWPHLARHIEQLRALEGTWIFERLEIDGGSLPGSMLTASRILIDGDRFRTESPEATYEGVFNLNVETDPPEIDIEFVAGPEAGNWNHGIFRIDGDRLEICLDLNGRPRPREFKTAAGRGHAWEVLRRASADRPTEVKGGTPPGAPVPIAVPADERAGFAYVPSPLLTQLQGEWKAVEIVRDGQKLPGFMARFATRSATKNEVRIVVGGQLMIHALVKFDPAEDPIAVDYYNLGGMAKDTIQHGILRWIEGDACFCMAAPGQPRPSDFTAPPGTGRTYSRWKKSKGK